MNKKLSFLVMLVCMLALGSVLIGCPTDSDDSSGGGGNPIKITGEAKVGSTLTATYDGKLAGGIFWENEDEKTLGNGTTYTIQASDVGKKIRASGTQDGGSYDDVYSDFVGPVTN
jgi:hypothetical protein